MTGNVVIAGYGTASSSRNRPPYEPYYVKALGCNSRPLSITASAHREVAEP